MNEKPKTIHLEDMFIEITGKFLDEFIKKLRVKIDEKKKAIEES